jgi:hypothetical protein
MTTVTTTDIAPPPPGNHPGNGDQSVPKAVSRRSPSAVTARRQVAERLRERREREEQLIVSAADALGRRITALEEAVAADHVLATAIRDLHNLGFTLDDVAEVLDVTVEELADQSAAGPAKSATGRGNRTRR